MILDKSMIAKKIHSYDSPPSSNDDHQRASPHDLCLQHIDALMHDLGRTCIALGILAQTPVTLSGKTILVEFMVIEDPLDFNILLGHDYVYAMKAMVSTLFRVMYFNHGKKLSLLTS